MSQGILLNEACTIMGNGPSRTKFDEFLRPIFACNAYYRDGDPDYLIAIDDSMVTEITNSSFPQHKLLLTPFEEQFEPFEWNPNRPRENAGMVAMRKAIKMNFKWLNCYGFDFLLDDPSVNMGNVYEGTRNYGPETQTSYYDAMRRVDYFDWFVRQNPNVHFNMIFPTELESKQFRASERDNLTTDYR